MPGMPGVAPRASAGLDLPQTSATWAIWGSWASVASGPGGAVLRAEAPEASQTWLGIPGPNYGGVDTGWGPQDS